MAPFQIVEYGANHAWPMHGNNVDFLKSVYIYLKRGLFGLTHKDQCQSCRRDVWSQLAEQRRWFQ